jgi:hypothetical protein
MEETIYAYRIVDIRNKLCRCGVCGRVERCTPESDFYGAEGAQLICEFCFRAKHGLNAPFLHTGVDGKPELIYTIKKPE